MPDDINAEILEKQGPRCIRPGCDQPWAEKAHIEPSGSGGRPSTYGAHNQVGLCKPCHDTFDGRDLSGRQRLLRDLMRSHADSVAERRRRLALDS